MRDWERRLASEAFAKGAHIPHGWNVDNDDGGDGCMPAGWYLIGLCRNGVPIHFPVRHEYGPFDSENEARGYIAEVMAAMNSKAEVAA
jgi:hypothetical protein